MARTSSHVSASLLLGILGCFGLSIFLAVINPERATIWQFGLFYVLVFAAVTGFAIPLGYFFRILFWRSGVRYEFLRSAEKQGALVGIFAVVCLILQSVGVLNLKTGVPLVVIFTLIQLYLS